MKTGWVACDHTQGNELDDVRHGPIRDTREEAEADIERGDKKSDYDGVRWVHDDGFLYVERVRRPFRISVFDESEFVCDGYVDSYGNVELHADLGEDGEGTEEVADAIACMIEEGEEEGKVETDHGVFSWEVA